MHYLGGKHRVSKQIVSYLSQWNDLPYLEPFVGAANIIIRMPNKIRIGSDIHSDLIALLIGVRDETFELPENISEEAYQLAKSLPPSALRGFIGFGCSFSGKFFAGFARDGTGRNYAKNAKNSLLKKRNGLIDVELSVKDYRDWNVAGHLIYCDCPYASTTKYSMKFNNIEFWEVMRKWSENNVVVISEYIAPNDFKSVLEIPTKLDMHSKSENKRVEKLFQYSKSTTFPNLLNTSLNLDLSLPQ